LQLREEPRSRCRCACRRRLRWGLWFGRHGAGGHDVRVRRRRTVRDCTSCGGAGACGRLRWIWRYGGGKTAFFWCRWSYRCYGSCSRRRKCLWACTGGNRADGRRRCRHRRRARCHFLCRPEFSRTHHPRPRPRHELAASAAHPGAARRFGREPRP
ncbi:unnamed protein product, partial [Ectocarpus sp. 8 AP-2014]